MKEEKNLFINPNNKQAIEPFEAEIFDEHKDTKYFSQINVIYRILINTGRSYTMLQMSRLTGIERASICRYFDKLSKRNLIKLVKRDKCPISKYVAGFYASTSNIGENEI